MVLQSSTAFQCSMTVCSIVFEASVFACLRTRNIKRISCFSFLLNNNMDNEVCATFHREPHLVLDCSFN